MERDFYPTPREAVPPLLPHLLRETQFCEPCAGNGALIDYLEELGGHTCVAAWDIDPRSPRVAKQDATDRMIGNIDCFITNPPWARPVLHTLIVHLSDQHPTWLLFDADWVHTQQAIPFMPRLRTIVSIGRLKWIPGTTMTGKDNCAWHLFTVPMFSRPAEFYGRLS